MRVKDMTGDVIGRLLVIERAGSRGGKAAWLCRCECGNEIVTTGADLRSGNTSSCGCLRNELSAARIPHPSGEEHPRYKGEDIGYAGAHYRVASLRGRAADHPCTDCGETAEDWSLRRGVATKLGTSAGYEVAYSTEPGDYEPRCRPCHTEYDKAVA